MLRTYGCLRRFQLAGNRSITSVVVCTFVYYANRTFSSMLTHFTTAPPACV